MGIRAKRIGKLADVGNNGCNARDMVNTVSEKGQLTCGQTRSAVFQYVGSQEVQEARTRGGQVWVCAMSDGELTRDGELEVEESSSRGHVKGEKIAERRPYVQSHIARAQERRKRRLRCVHCLPSAL